MRIADDDGIVVVREGWVIAVSARLASAVGAMGARFLKRGCDLWPIPGRHHRCDRESTMRPKDMNNQRLSRIERKLELLPKVAAKLDLLPRLDAKVDLLARHIVGVDAKVEVLARRVAVIDAKLDSIIETQSHINSDLSDKVKGHETRIGALEKRTYA